MYDVSVVPVKVGGGNYMSLRTLKVCTLGK